MPAMKKIFVALAAAMLLNLFGCCCSKQHEDHIEPVVQHQTTPLGAFNDETYVWESWWFGTNKVDKLESKSGK